MNIALLAVIGRDAPATWVNMDHVVRIQWGTAEEDEEAFNSDDDTRCLKVYLSTGDSLDVVGEVEDLGELRRCGWGIAPESQRAPAQVRAIYVPGCEGGVDD